MIMELDELLTDQELIKKWGKKLGIKTPKKLWEYRRNGLLGFYRIGKKVLYGPHHIKDFVSHFDLNPAK